uniref:CASP-like protein n=1 Tax=Heterorhabditis bacteriophora TaxID=37862 RepID=A0A1I7XP43_HETBA
MQSSAEVGRYAFKATPLQFQMASYWYFIRLKALAALFALDSVLSMCVLCMLYFGIQCRYHTLTQFPQKPDIMIRTSYLA